tara:strand:- start:1610 stop:3403 length:1794 start_codon:yes stop_codon:yes gene_type:complete
MYIPDDFKERLLATVSIVEVIQKRRQVERRGSGYMAKCPFHKGGEESNASMKIYEETGTYHCFTCKETGNAISFLMKHDNLDFVEAVEQLASYVGMEIPINEKFSKTNSVSIDINNKAAEIFYEQLTHDFGKNTINYLKDRGISGETAKFFRLGYSNIKSPSLYEKLSKEFEQKDLDESGLFGKNDNGEFYDRFKDRLMFPIRNIKGDAIAFGGRLLQDKEKQAKYLNSPATKTYNKKYELYGLHEVRQHNKRPESIYVVEGYMDVVGLFEHGIKNAVASSGTAFTQEQLRKILNYTNKVYIVFDGDEAGMKASWRTVENAMMLLREDTRINFIFLAEGEDPDSYIKTNGKDAFLDLAKNSTSLSDYFFDTVKSYDDLSSIEGRTAAAKYALPLIKSVTNETIKQAYIKEMSKICDLDFSKLIDTNQNKPNIIQNKGKNNAVKSNSNSILIKSVIGIFTSLIQHPKLAQLTLFNSIKKDSRFSFVNDIKNLYIESPDSSASVILEKIYDEKIKNIFGEASVSSIQMSEDDAKSMIEDCLNIILKTGLDNQEREEALKEKFSIEALSLDEKRELQQILLKKDKMSDDEALLLKNLSSK